MKVESHDEVTRFIRPKEKDYVTALGNLKTAAFKPHKNDNAVSVFITSLMSLDEIWEHGKLYFEVLGNTIIGRAKLLAGVVYETDLNFDYNNNPPRHANIIGFSDEKPKLLIQKQRLAMNSIYEKRK